MFQNFRIIFYSMIVTLVSVLILPVEGKAFISEPDVGKCKNGQADCQNNSSTDTAPPISPRGLKVKGESGKTKGKYPADPNTAFPMSEWTPNAKSSGNGANKITQRNEKKK